MPKAKVNQESIVSLSEEETFSIARDFLGKIENSGFVCLFGDLGSGKTVFVKGLAASLGIDDYMVKSPTYTFVREYPHKKGRLIHVDLYRLDVPDEILFKQINEFKSKKGTLIVIEWADRMIKELPEKRHDICFEYVDRTSRKITFF